MPGKIAWIAGANGLIGSQLCRLLSASELFAEIYAFVRNTEQTHFQHPKLSYVECDWEALSNAPSDFPAPSKNVDTMFCALGSTKKKTPDALAYHRIDVGYPVAFAQLGMAYGATSYGLVSAHGASSRAISSYLKMKAEVEHKLTTLNFKQLAIARPSLLLGDRDEFRALEKASEFVCKMLPGDLKAIDATDVAAALIQISLTNNTGVNVLNSASMQGLRQAAMR